MSAHASDPEVVKSIPEDAIHLSDNSPRHAGGRPTKLTVARFLRICGWIQQGRSNTVACRAEGVDYTTFRAHTRRKRRWTWRYELADKVRDETLQDIHLSNIARHAKESWQASAWILSHKFSHIYSTRGNADDDNADRPQYAELTREQLLASIARAKELEAEAPVGWQPLPDAAPAG